MPIKTHASNLLKKISAVDKLLDAIWMTPRVNSGSSRLNVFELAGDDLPKQPQ